MKDGIPGLVLVLQLAFSDELVLKVILSLFKRLIVHLGCSNFD